MSQLGYCSDIKTITEELCVSSADSENYAAISSFIFRGNYHMLGQGLPKGRSVHLKKNV